MLAPHDTQGLVIIGLTVASVALGAIALWACRQASRAIEYASRSDRHFLRILAEGEDARRLLSEAEDDVLRLARQVQTLGRERDALRSTKTITTRRPGFPFPLSRN